MLVVGLRATNIFHSNSNRLFFFRLRFAICILLFLEIIEARKAVNGKYFFVDTAIRDISLQPYCFFDIFSFDLIILPLVNWIKTANFPEKYI